MITLTTEMPKKQKLVRSRHASTEIVQLETELNHFGHRIWTPEQKSMIVAETLLPGMLTKTVAHKYGVNPSLLSKWRADAKKRKRSSIKFVQDNTPKARETKKTKPPEKMTETHQTGILEISYKGVTVHVDHNVDANRTSEIISALRNGAVKDLSTMTRVAN